MKLRIAPLPATGLAMLAAINAWLLASIADDMFSPDEQPLGATMEWAPKLPDPGEGFVDSRPIDAAQRDLAASVVLQDARAVRAASLAAEANACAGRPGGPRPGAGRGRDQSRSQEGLPVEQSRPTRRLGERRR
jgi:hypothetical protein